MPAAPPYSGRCLCGEIEYRLNEDPVTYYACHCTDCQKRSGSSFGLSMWVKRDSLEVAKGEPTLVTPTGPDGTPRYQRNCPKCGIRLWSEPAKHPGIAILRPGSLDDAKAFEPVAHIWMRSAHPWVQIPEGVARFDQHAGHEELARLWRERRKIS